MDYLIHHIIRSKARETPHKEALVHKHQRLTYADLDVCVAQVAKGLASLSCQRGDRIGVYLEPSIPQVVSFFGISKCGGVLVPINQELLPEQIIHIACDSGMKGLITNSDKLHLLSPFLKEMQSLEFLIVIGKTAEGSQEVSLPTIFYEDLVLWPVSEQGGDSCIEKDLAAILYTSGSTGKPKGVMLTHSQILAGSSIVSTYLSITKNDRILAVLPFSFDAGLNQVMTAFQQGGTLVLINFIFAREIVQILQSEHITGLAGVPTLWNLLAQPRSGLHKISLPSLRYITNTGGAMPQPVLQVLRKVLPETEIFLMYGLTEAFRSTYLPPEELDSRPTSMGKAIPNTEILVINDRGEPCQPWEIGELIHRGPTVSLGYWGNPTLTSQVLRPHPFLSPDRCLNEKVCYSGDLVKMDEEGFLYFIGRRDSMIKSAGFRISRTEIEEVLLHIEGVQEAAVIGIPDKLLGQAVKAFVVGKDGENVDSSELITICREHLPGYMVPRTIEVVAALPKTPHGKIDYPFLQNKLGAGN